MDKFLDTLLVLNKKIQLGDFMLSLLLSCLKTTKHKFSILSKIISLFGFSSTPLHSLFFFYAFLYFYHKNQYNYCEVQT